VSRARARGRTGAASTFVAAVAKGFSAGCR
jgi:hypothetical protein